MKASDVKCGVCNRTMFDTPMYRHTPMNQPCKEWRCIDHVDIQPDPTVREISEIIAEAKEDGDE